MTLLEVSRYAIDFSTYVKFISKIGYRERDHSTWLQGRIQIVEERSTRSTDVGPRKLRPLGDYG